MCTGDCVGRDHHIGDMIVHVITIGRVGGKAACWDSMES